MGFPLRVVARVRPPAENEDICMDVIQTASHILIGNGTSYDFNPVFSKDTSQKELYSACLEDIINKFYYRGVNATVVTYGQRGSGKTYTTTGPEFYPWAMNEEQFGILPRAVRHIFELMKGFPGREYQIQISYLIIHEDSVYDLLSSGPSLIPLNISQDDMGNVVIPVRTVTCKELKDVFCCLFEVLAQKDSVSKNGFDLSSAHSIFTLNLQQQWIEPDSRVNFKADSLLNFVDLAGWDERGYTNSSLSQPGMDSVFPNADLKALINIINCLASKGHQQGNNLSDVPYNQSRLTQILKEAFGGNSLTLMVCCLSPSQKDLEATYSTFKVASLARHVFNYPTINVVMLNNLHQSSTNTNHSPFNINLLNSSRSSSLNGNQSSISIPSQMINNVPVQPYPPPVFAPFYAPQQNNLLPIIQTVPVAPISNGTCEEGIDIEDDEIFRVQFAASQWQLLVSSAEDLLAEILQGGSVSPTEKSRIQSWLCMKAEADDCIGSDVAPLNPTQGSIRPLDVIEELSEPNEPNGSLSSSSLDSESELSSEVSFDEDFYQNLENFKQQFFQATTNLIKETQSQCDTIARIHQIKCGKKPHFPECSTPLPQAHVISSKLENTTKDIPMSSTEMMSISTEEEEPTRDRQIEIVNEKDKENLQTKFGSKDNLLASHNKPFHSARKEMKYRLSSRKIRTKPKIKVGKGNSELDFEMLSSSDSKGSFADSSSAKDKDVDSESGFRKVSSKLLSVSKGSSKCVDSFKSKSSQIKRSIKSHIFRKKDKNAPFSMEMVEQTKRDTYSTDNEPSAIGSIDLKKAEVKLQELNATIKSKEALIFELKRGSEEAETTHLKCQRRIEIVKGKIKQVDKQHEKEQSKLMQVSNEEEKDSIRKSVDAHLNQIKDLNKELECLKKISALTLTSKLSVPELEKNIKELREQQEELQTKLRLETQRKEQLERLIHINKRCLKKPLATINHELDDTIDEEEKNKENLFPTPLQTPLSQHSPEKANFLSQSALNQSIKRKFASSTGDSQGKTTCTSLSQEGACRTRVRTKAGKIDHESMDEDYKNSLKPNNQEGVIRKDIADLRDARDGLIYQRQELGKVFRKGRSSGVQPSFSDEKRLLELDETIEGIDCVIEHKNQLIFGSATNLEETAKFLTNYELVEKIRSLSLEEILILLVKYFDKAIDLRIEFRKQELDYAELENLYDERNRLISRREAAYKQASLEMDHHLTSLHREYQSEISALYRHFNKSSSLSSAHQSRVLQLEEQLMDHRHLLQAAKKKNREFKHRLRDFYYLHNNSHHSKALPGATGTQLGKLENFSHKRRSAIIDRGGSSQPEIKFIPQTEVRREKKKIIIEQKKDPKAGDPRATSHHKDWGRH